MKWVITGFVTVVLMSSVATSSSSSDSNSDSKTGTSTTAAPGEQVVIPTRFGYIRGERLPTKKGHFVEYFKGVPFAEKPERLKKSVLVHRWNGVRDARSYPKKCIGVVRPVNSSEFSEDCLYLNIVRPAGTTNVNRLPVVVFVHGGGFVEGFGNDAPCEAFAENFVSENLIVVNIQYRLAMSGFLSLGCSNPIIPCNIGLWDQLTAFQFVNRTIRDFGGDTSNMTLMGHSAGSMAVSLHSISPISSQFFTNYIQMSGSSWSLTRYKESNFVQSKKILEDLNCNITSQQLIFECINRTSLDDMYTAQIDTHLWPEFGDALLPDIPDRIVNNTRNQRLMMGIMELESLYFTYLKSSPEIFPFIHRDTVDEYINSTIAIQYGIDSNDAFLTASGYYLEPNASDSDYPYFMRQRTKIQSNIDFDIPMLRELNQKKQHSPDVFFYYFPYFNPAEFDPDFPVNATYHCHEFPYVWGIYKDNYFELNEDDSKVSEFLVGAFVNFIKTGNPSSFNYTWPQVDDHLTYTVIQPKPVTGKNNFKSDYEFWDRMAQTFQYDIITGLPVETLETTTSGSAVCSYLLIISLIILTA